MSDDLTRQEIEAIEALLKLGRLSSFARAKLEGRLMWLRSVYVQPEIRAFAEKLKNRQGTTMPDFDALYRRKAELDADAL